MRLRERGFRVAYVDIDAHHGDGVQAAFYADPNVLTISTHERGDRLFPGTGFVVEMGEGDGLGYSVNVPLQPLTDDAVYHEAFEAVVPPLVTAFKPDALVIQLGIDSHRTDPLTHLSLTVQGFTCAVRRLLPLAPRIVALGGGGYDLTNVARAWTAAWAAMNDMELPEALPRECHKDMQRLGLGTLTLSDPPETLPADTRHWAEEYARRQVGEIQAKIFPRHGL
jgi:acetoin utilization protein AcuC